MVTVPLSAIGANSAASVDVAHHALPVPARVIRHLHCPHEFVAGHALVTQVSAVKLQVGVADAGKAQADQRLAGPTSRDGKVVHAAGRATNRNGEHDARLSAEAGQC
jgi:hypothetical protein